MMLKTNCAATRLNALGFERFPELGDLATEFVEKNEIMRPIRKVETHAGLVLVWDKDLVLLSGEVDGDLTSFMEPMRQPNIGGSGSYSSRQMNYALSGILRGEPVVLGAEVVYTQRYITERVAGWCQGGVAVPKPHGDPQKSIFRKDNLPYWFLMPQRQI